MADVDDVRRLALALPEVHENDSDGFDFQVAGKGIIWSYPERRPGRPRAIRTDIAVLFVGDEAEKQALLLGEPAVFFTAPGHDGWPLVLVRLARVGVRRLEELIVDAWRMRAPIEVLADQVLMPHSVLPVPAQRPARGSSPSSTRRVHGAQPIDGIAVVGERVDQHAVGGDVGVDVVLGPGRDRVDLDHVALGVPVDDAGARPGSRPRRAGRRTPRRRSGSSARASGSTLRIAQHRSGSRSCSRGPNSASCSATVRSGRIVRTLTGSVAATASRVPIVSAKW